MVLLRKGSPPAQRSLLRLPTPDRGGGTAREGPEADGGRVPESVPTRKAVDRGRALGPRSSLPWSSTTRETAWSACLTGRGPVGAAADPSTLTRSVSLSAPPPGRHPQCGCRSWSYSGPHARSAFWTRRMSLVWRYSSVANVCRSMCGCTSLWPSPAFWPRHFTMARRAAL
jgi:hypothetical protein